MNIGTVAALSVHWIEAEDQLGDLLVQAPEAWAVDTEFMREQTYYPQLALLQISDGTTVWLLDPLKLPAAAMLQAVRRAAPCLLYAASEDLSVFEYALGWRPNTIVDAQVAAAFLGLGPALSLRDILLQRLDVMVDKSETRSNWLQRPLSEQQRLYAASDVAWLHKLWAPLEQMLSERGFSAWFRDECRRLCARVSLVIEAQPHWSLRSNRELPEDVQRRLFRLLHWRDQLARESDRPRNWIAPPALLFALAERNPRELGQVVAILQKLQLPGTERRARTLLGGLCEARAEEAHFLAAPAPLDRAQRALAAQFKQWVEKRATELGIPPELLAPRRLLDALARNQAQWPDEFTGWRQEALRDLSGTTSAGPASAGAANTKSAEPSPA